MFWGRGVSCKTLCVAGAKGGAGKTTVALSLAVTHPDPESLLFIDADVEEPNAALFLHPRWDETREIFRKIPVVNDALCDGCGACARACGFGAILMLGETPSVMVESCHSCGACALVCPRGAIGEVDAPLGKMSRGRAGSLEILSGEMEVGAASGVPLVRAEKDSPFGGKLRIMDCPPGTGCAVVEAVRGADFCLLVTEPTPFGLHDLAAAVELLRILHVPCGVLVNRTGLGEDRSGEDKIADFCRRENLPVLGGIPHDRRIAAAYAEGGIPVLTVPELAALFSGLWHKILAALT